MTLSGQEIVDYMKSIRAFLDKADMEENWPEVERRYHLYDLQIKLMALDRLNVIATKLEDVL